MPNAVRRALAVTVGASLLIAMAGGGQALAAKSTKKVNAKATLASLVNQTQSLPRAAASTAAKARLLRRARHARAVASKSPCGAVKDLTSYRKSLKSTKIRASARGKRNRERLRQRLAALAPASLKASRKLLSDKRTRSCGGGVTLPTITGAQTSVLRSDANGMSLRVKLPALGFVPEQGGGKQWTKLVLPKTDSPASPGDPGIPVSSSLIAVPDGAKLEVHTTKTESYTLDGVDVFPAQPEPVDAAAPGLAPKPNFQARPFTEAPFVVDDQTYAKNTPIPAAPADGDQLGQVRDLNIGQLGVASAQYNPKTDKLKVLTEVQFDIAFVGGTKTFSDALGSPWEVAQNRFAGTLLNSGVVRQIDHPIIYQPCGEELLVITNPSTLASANTYATARRAAGFLTRVVQTGAAAGQIGTTATQIQTYIRGQVNHPFCIRPSYVTIIGDDEFVPTFTTGPGGIPSDNPYSTKNDADELPDVAIGRILGNTSAQLDAQLAKIIHYETSPPIGAMLNKAIVAAQFQDTDAEGEVNDGQEDRTFFQFAETVRNGLAARGVAVDRIYEDNPTTNPTKFNDGTAIPAALQKPAFGWDGDGADVSAAWNNGRFMVVHRDHGWSDGWGDPFFTTTEVDALTNSNDNLPVVLSINCASAQYDTDETSFTQNALVKPTGGAVGVFGDTRNSPSWHNSQLALGFVDALLPTVLSGEGPSSKQRMGNALINGKLRLAGLAPPSGPGIAGGDGNTRNELYLWHYFGDPTMQMFGGGSAPIVFNPNVFRAIYRELPIPKPGDPPPFLVELTFPSNPALTGQPISLLRNGQVIGKALAGDGSVSIPATFNDGAPRPGELEVALEADGAAPIKIPVSGGNVPPPPPPTPTTLTQTCPTSVPYNPNTGATVTVRGTLAGAPPGSQVSVTFVHPQQSQTSTNPTNPPTNVVVTTDAQGNWTASVSTASSPNPFLDVGLWSVSSSYAGTSAYAASMAEPCTFNVTFTQ
ncbi:MAG: hypothetical protein QOE31_3955 [Solirubrobacteraceae bacterium]|nr:hypothetical protein [Solirubrobacteraceae bacterium]